MKFDPKLERWRYLEGPFATKPGDTYGAFKIVAPRRRLQVIACDGRDVGELSGWEHVSVSVINNNRLPTWEEMCYVKDLFWGENEMVVQYHPRRADYVSNWRVLHLWRPIDQIIPAPPPILVGIKALGELGEARRG